MAGTLWMMLLRLAERSIGLVSTLILARLLTPADFGLVAMATAVLALIELMGAFGFDIVLIQRKHAERVHYDTAWTFNLLFGIATAILLIAMAVPAAGFYHEPRLTWILIALSISALAQGFSNIGTVAFRKEMNFRKEFYFMVSKKLAAFVVTISLALTFRSYWALVGGIVTGKIVSVWISYRIHPYRPKFTLAGRHELFHFSKWLFISNLVLLIQNKADSFILGKTVGALGLGLYNVAGELAALPSTELIAPLNRAAFPAYAQLSSSLEDLRKKFLEIFGFIALVAIPASVGLASVADPVVRVLLGPQWVNAIPILQILAVCGLMSSLQSNLIVVITALGKPKANTLLSATMATLYIPTVVYASLHYGTLGAAWAHLIMSILVQIPLNIVFLRLTDLHYSLYFGTLWRPMAASLVMAVCLSALFASIISAVKFSPLLELIISIVTGSISYVTTILVLWAISGKPKTSAEFRIVQMARYKFRITMQP